MARLSKSQQLEKIAMRIRPVVRFAFTGAVLSASSEGELYYIFPAAIRSGVSLLNPVPESAAGGLEKFMEINTKHEVRLTFAPIQADILRQIPKEHKKNVVAYEILSPQIGSECRPGEIWAKIQLYRQGSST